MSNLAARRHARPAAEMVVAGRVVIGLALIGTFWTISWLGLRPLSDYYFFPLWLGYILTVDGVVALRTGTSPIQRSGWRIVGLFGVSVPLWWAFEAINEVVQNWRYHQPVRYTTVEYALLASVAFSTVVPAVLTTAELVQSFRLDPLRRLPRIRPTQPLLLGIHLIGWAMLALTLIWPRLFFPMVWLSGVFLLDPVVTWLGGRSLTSFIDRRDWSPLFNLALGTLICGWFWEMWNVYSLPKWTYAIPYAEHLHVFEMPLLGYGGYIPFAFEVYLCTELVRLLMPFAKLPETRVSTRFD